MLALGRKQMDHIPYRQSKLTNFLRDSLGGNCMTRMIANIRCDASHIEETMATLNFAMRMMKVSNDALVNEVEDPSEKIARLQKEVKDLKAELAFQDTLADRTGGIYEPFTPEQKTDLLNVLSKYCRGELTAIPVTSLRQVRETFNEFRNMVLDLEVQVEKAKLAQPTARPGTVPTTGEELGAGANAEGSTVGDVEDEGGFGLGVAADNAGPEGGLTQAMSPSNATLRRESDPFEQTVAAPIAKARSATAPAESEAFEEYKQNIGSDLNERYEDAKSLLLTKKKEMQEVSREVNSFKRDIDQITEDIQYKRSTSSVSNAEDVIDEEEYALIQKLKEKKHEYKVTFQLRKQLSSEVTTLKNQSEAAKIELCNTFLSWYNGLYGGMTQASATSASNGDDVLDDGEQFEILERQRVMEADPKSISFYNAKKALQVSKQTRAMQRTGGVRR